MIVRFDNHCLNCLFINKLLITNIMDKICSRAPGFTTSCVAGFLFFFFKLLSFLYLVANVTCVSELSII